MSECAADRCGAKKPAGIAPNGRHIQTQKSGRNNYFAPTFGSRKMDEPQINVKSLNSESFKHLFDATELG